MTFVNDIGTVLDNRSTAHSEQIMLIFDDQHRSVPGTREVVPFRSSMGEYTYDKTFTVPAGNYQVIFLCRRDGHYNMKHMDFSKMSCQITGATPKDIHISHNGFNEYLQLVDRTKAIGGHQTIEGQEAIKNQPTKFFYTFIEQYEQMTGNRYCTRKHIFEDKPKKKDKNVMFLQLEPATAFLHEEFPYWEHIQWGLDNNIEIFIDYSWEFTEAKLRPGIEDQYFWYKYKDYLIENNIKIISQYLESTDAQWPGKTHQDLRKIVHNVNLFEYNVRINHERNNIEWRINASPKEVSKKKYFLNFIPGEIRKYPATLMLQALFNEIGKENIFYSTVLGDYFSKYMMTWDDLEFLWEQQIRWYSKEHQSLFLQCLKNQDNLHQHLPFEDQYNISSFDLQMEDADVNYHYFSNV